MRIPFPSLILLLGPCLLLTAVLLLAPLLMAFTRLLDDHLRTELAASRA